MGQLQFCGCPFLYLSPHFFPVLLRGKCVFALEDTVKVHRIAETGLSGDLRNALPGQRKEVAGVLQAVMGQKLREGFSGHFFDHMRGAVVAQVEQISQLFQCEIPG